jgi:haloalkane dehalogenase
MRQLRKGYVNCSAGQIHFRTNGAVLPDRVLLLLHQTASSSAMFERLIAALPADLPVFAPDTPGYGASFQPVTPLQISDYAHLLAETLHAAGIRRAVVFGHHTGAALAVALAAEFPTMVDGLILSGPPLLSDEQKQQLAAGLTAGELSADGDHLLKVWKRIQSRSPHSTLDLVQRETLLTLGASRYADTYRAVFAQDFSGQLAQLTCRTLVIVGQHDTIRASAEPTRAILGCDLIEIAAAGTYLCDEQPQAVAAIIQDFWKI